MEPVEVSDHRLERIQNALAGMDTDLRLTWAATEDGTVVFELEWKGGPFDGETFTAAFSPERWIEFTDSIAEARESLA